MRGGKKKKKRERREKEERKKEARNLLKERKASKEEEKNKTKTTEKVTKNLKTGGCKRGFSEQREQRYLLKKHGVFLFLFFSPKITSQKVKNGQRQILFFLFFGDFFPAKFTHIYGRKNVPNSLLGERHRSVTVTRK